MKASKGLMISMASVLAYFLALWLIASVLARYSRDLGFGIAETSLVWSSISLVSFVLRPIAGHLADRTNSHYSMAVGGILIALSSMLYLIAGDFSHLLLGRVIQGFGNAFFISPSVAAVAVAAGDLASIAIGIRSMLISLGGIIAPPLAGLIVDNWGYPLVFLLALLLGIFIFSLNVPEARHQEARRVEEKAGWRDAINLIVVLMIVLSALSGAVFMTISGLLQSQYRDLGYGASIYGYFAMFSSISGVFSRYLAGKFSVRSNPMKIMVAGYLLVLLSTLGLEFMYKVPGSFLVAVIYGFGIGLTIPPQQYVTLESVPSSVKNRAIALYSMGGDAGRFAGPMIFGLIASISGYLTSYLYLSIVPLLAVAISCAGMLKLDYSSALASPDKL